MVKALRTHVKLLTFTVFPELALAKPGRLLLAFKIQDSKDIYSANIENIKAFMNKYRKTDNTETNKQ